MRKGEKRGEILEEDQKYQNHLALHSRYIPIFPGYDDRLYDVCTSKRISMWPARVIFLLFGLPFLASQIEEIEPSLVFPSSSSSHHQQSETPRYNRTEIIQKYTKEQVSRNILIQEKSRIYREWDLRHYPLFLETFHIPHRSWKLYKAKFTNLLIRNLVSKNESKFVIGFTGSSVTAGHDNYFNESYPAVVEKTLQRVFRPLGISLEVRNHAMGNNPCYPYDTCMSTHVGDDLDIITWEQSMNCGRNPKPVESFIRSVSTMPKKPMVIFIASGTPYWKPSECSTPSLRGNSSLSPREIDLLRLPLSVVANSSSYVFEHLPFFEAAENLLDHYESVISPSVQSVSDVISTYKCRGPYDGTFGKKTKGEGKAWHPGLLGHKYRADSLSYFLLEIFKEALDDVIVASMEGPKTLHDLRQQALEALTLSGAHLPKPVACDPQVCLKIPKCFTNYEPRIQNDLLERIVPTRDLPQSSFPKSSQQFSLASLLPLNWAYDLSWFDKAGVKKASDEQRGYLDQKYILRSNFSGSGPLTEEDGESVLTFLVEPSVRSPIWICQVQKGFLKYPSTDSELDVGASVSITSHVDHNVMRSFHSGLKGTPLSLVRVEDECFKTELVDTGRHYLSIWPKNRSSQINVAYILYW